jgi:hypothetical protein
MKPELEGNCRDPTEVLSRYVLGRSEENRLTPG